MTRFDLQRPITALSLLRRHRWLLATAAVTVAILVSFGNWQLRRLDWKEGLIARIESRIGSQALNLPPATAWTEVDFVDRFEYQPVRVTGTFHQPGSDASDFRRYYAYTVLTAPRGKAGGQGYWVMNLFRPSAGGAVFVNRGFVPRADKESEAPPPSGEVTVVGLVRKPSRGNFLTPRCEVADGICFANDVESAAVRAGINDGAAFYIELGEQLTPEAGLPQAGETRVRFSNNHLQYALTWFGLAAALVGVLGAFLLNLYRVEKNQA